MHELSVVRGEKETRVKRKREVVIGVIDDA